MSTVLNSGSPESELDVSYRLMPGTPPENNCEDVYALPAKILEELYPKMTWMVDSGASYHLCNNKDWFSTLNEDASVRTFNVAHSSQLITKGLGCVDIPLRDAVTGGMKIQSISKVYYAPDQPFNLLSVARLIQYNGFDNPDFVGNKLKSGTNTYNMVLKGGTYTLNSTSVCDTMAPAEAPDAEATSKRDPAEWKWKTSEYVKHAQLYGRNGSFDVDLFTDGKGKLNGNSQEEAWWCPKENAFTKSWYGKAFYGCPVFQNQFIHKMLKKATEDFEYDPENTTHMFVVPVMPQATWWHLTKYYTEICRYPAGQPIFSVPKNASKGQQPLDAATSEDGKNRVMIKGCSFDVVVLHRDSSTPIRTDDYIKAHLRFGHYGPKHLSALIDSGVETGLKLNQKSLLGGSGRCKCRTCIISKVKRPVKGRKHDLEKIYGNLDIYEYVVSDITGPIDPMSIDGSRYLIHFTCIRSRYTEIFGMAYKSKAGYYLEKFLLLLRRPCRVDLDIR